MFCEVLTGLRSRDSGEMCVFKRLSKEDPEDPDRSPRRPVAQSTSKKPERG